jgi:hypothetical protein
MTTDPCAKCGQTHDPEKCTGHNAQGLPCGKAPMKGGTVCRTHGGSAPQVRAAAERRQLEAAAEDTVRNMLWPGLRSAEPVKDPVASLERLAGGLEQLVDQAGARVAALQHLAGGKDLTQLRAEVTLLERALGHLRGVLVDMARLGIAERHVQLEQQRADVIVGAFRAALAAVSLLPADEQLMLGTFLERLGDVVPGEVVA